MAPVIFAVIPVMTLCAVVERDTAPALLPLPADCRVTSSVTPAGIAVLICAVMVYELGAPGFETVYVVRELVTAVGADPAIAALTVSWAGEPDTVICARASLVQQATARSSMMRFIWIAVGRLRFVPVRLRRRP